MEINGILRLEGQRRIDIAQNQVFGECRNRLLLPDLGGSIKFEQHSSDAEQSALLEQHA